MRRKTILALVLFGLLATSWALFGADDLPGATPRGASTIPESSSKGSTCQE